MRWRYADPPSGPWHPSLRGSTTRYQWRNKHCHCCGTGCDIWRSNDQRMRGNGARTRGWLGYWRRCWGGAQRGRCACRKRRCSMTIMMMMMVIARMTASMSTTTLTIRQYQICSSLLPPGWRQWSTTTGEGPTSTKNAQQSRKFCHNNNGDT